MMQFRSISLPTLLVFCVALVVVGIVSLFAHELGHGLTAEILGGSFTGLYVWPGIQIWPTPGKQYEDDWQGAVGRATFDPGPHWEEDGWQSGLTDLMGSGSNLLLAALALGALCLFRPKGWLRLLLIAEALLFADLLLYVFLPQVGLRHFFFIGGDYAEPLEGAVAMGIPAWVFMVLVALVSALMTWGLVKYVWQDRNRIAPQGSAEA